MSLLHFYFFYYTFYLYLNYLFQSAINVTYEPLYKMFQTIGDFHENHAALLSLYFYFSHPPFSFLLVSRYSSWGIHCESGLTNRDHEVGKNRSCIGISTIRRIWVRNSSPSFLLHASDPFPLSDPRRSIDPDWWLFVVGSILLSPSLFFSLSFLRKVRRRHTMTDSTYRILMYKAWSMDAGIK